MRIRRLLAVAAIVGAGIGIAGTAEHASAYCGQEIFTDGTNTGGNGCSNPCPESPRLLDKYGLGWECLQ